MKKILLVALAGMFLNSCDIFEPESDFVNPNLPPYTNEAAGTVGLYINDYAWRYDETYLWWGGSGEEAVTTFNSGDTTWIYLRGLIQSMITVEDAQQKPLPADIGQYNYLEITFVDQELPAEGETKVISLDGSPNGYFRFTRNNWPSNPDPKTNPGEGVLRLRNTANFGWSGTFAANLTTSEQINLKVSHGRFDN